MDHPQLGRVGRYEDARGIGAGERWPGREKDDYDAALARARMDAAQPQAPDMQQSVAFFEEIQGYLANLNQVLSETAAILDQVHLRTFGPVVPNGAENTKASTPSANAPAALAQLRDAIGRAHVIQEFAHRLNARL